MVATVFAGILGTIVGSTVAAFLFRPVFGDRSEFLRCVGFWLTPDIISLSRGQYGRDWFAEAKLGAWLAAGVFSGLGTYLGLSNLIG